MQKTVSDSFENLGATVSQIVKPVADEAGKLVETAKAQIAGDTGTSEQAQGAQSGQSQQTTALRQQAEAEREARTKAIRNKLHQMMQTPPRRPEKTVDEKKEQEKQVKQFNLAKKEREKPPPISVTKAKTAAEKQRGVSG